MLIIFFVVFTAIYYIDKRVDRFIAKGVKVYDMEIGNLTREQAYQKLSILKLKIPSKPVYIRYEGELWKLSLYEVGIEIGVDSIIDSAFNAAKADSLINRLILQYNIGGRYR